MEQGMKRWTAGLLVGALTGLALACQDGQPTSARSALNASDLHARASAFGGATEVRWDIVSNAPPTDFNVRPGGMASALANDGSQITLTGSGTFMAPASGGATSAVTGGGTWTTTGPSGSGSGTYEVTGLVRWQEAPGSLPSAATDLVGDAADARPGLVVLRIAYSDGSRGTLTVSCHLAGTSDGVFEGVTASKGFVDYWNRAAPVANVNANRTLFHVVQ